MSMSRLPLSKISKPVNKPRSNLPHGTQHEATPPSTAATIGRTYHAHYRRGPHQSEQDIVLKLQQVPFATGGDVFLLVGEVPDVGAQTIWVELPVNGKHRSTPTEQDVRDTISAFAALMERGGEVPQNLRANMPAARITRMLARRTEALPERTVWPITNASAKAEEGSTHLLTYKLHPQDSSEISQTLHLIRNPGADNHFALFGYVKRPDGSWLRIVVPANKKMYDLPTENSVRELVQSIGRMLESGNPFPNLARKAELDADGSREFLDKAAKAPRAIPHAALEGFDTPASRFAVSSWENGAHGTPHPSPEARPPAPRSLNG